MAKNGNGYSEAVWAKIRDAFERGASVKDLEAMGPKRKAIYARVKSEGWDASKRNGNGHNGKARKQGNRKQRGGNRKQAAASNAPAPVLPDPDLVEGHFRRPDVLEETVRTVTTHADASNVIVAMAIELRKVVRDELYERMPDGKLKLRAGVTSSQVKQKAGVLKTLLSIISSGNALYRKNRGLYDGKQQHELSGRVDGSDTFASFLGFALRGAGEGAVGVPEGVARGQEPVQDLGGQQEDREELSRSN